jgi:hypothetical protein
MRYTMTMRTVVQRGARPLSLRASRQVVWYKSWQRRRRTLGPNLRSSSHIAVIALTFLQKSYNGNYVKSSSSANASRRQVGQTIRWCSVHLPALEATLDSGMPVVTSAKDAPGVKPATGTQFYNPLHGMGVGVLARCETSLLPKI